MIVDFVKGLSEKGCDLTPKSNNTGAAQRKGEGKKVRFCPTVYPLHIPKQVQKF